MFIIGFDRIGCTPVLVQRLLDGADQKAEELEKKKQAVRTVAKIAANQAVRRAVDERQTDRGNHSKPLGERPLSAKLKSRYGL